MPDFLLDNDEARLRELANGIARQIENPKKLLARLELSNEDYQELCETRTFRTMLAQATLEWEGAGNTHKRIKQKAAVNIELALVSFYHAMIDPREPLSSRVKMGELVTRIAGLGNPEPVVAGSGQYFNLQINLGKGQAPVIISNESITAAYEVNFDVPEMAHSALFDALPFEELCPE